MYNSNIPTDRELPSTTKLVKSTILAIATALILLITVVMPAEYGVDPTGIGRLTGLKKMGEIKVSLAQEAEAERQASVQAMTVSTTPIANVEIAEQQDPPMMTDNQKPSSTQREDEMTVTLVPNEGTEIKVDMQKGQTVNYTWSTDGGKANFDVHGDSKILNIDYHNYEKGAEQQKEGTLEAAFNGSHGWFWRNRTTQPITIVLKTYGEYSAIKKVK